MSSSFAGDHAAHTAVAEAGLFNRYGVAVGTFLATHDSGQTRWLRLDTTFSSDFPSRRTTLRIGDANNLPGAWGRQVHFGGVQYGTNFTTQPGFLTLPLQAVAGRAVVPSVVDVYMNNALVMTREVPPGPFSVDRIPVTTGSGNLRLVVRDVANREQAITVTQPFYGTSSLLARGLSEYSVEGGWIREDFGIASNGYGPAFASATLRHGLTDRFTAEARGEATRDGQVAGLTGTFLNPALGVFEAGGAVSRSERRTGNLLLAGYSRQGVILSVGARSQWASDGFRQLGAELSDLAPRSQHTVNVGLQLGRIGSLSATYASQSFRVGDPVSVATVGFSRQFGALFHLQLLALKTMGRDKGSSFSAYVTVPLGPRTTAGASASQSRSEGVRQNDTTVSLQRSLPPGEGSGYRLAMRNRDLEASGAYQTNANRFQVDVARFEGGTSGRAEVSGGVGYLGGHAFLSRSITGSFGVVQVADYPGVSVLLENQVVSRTNARGFAVLPDLRPYERNKISLREGDLPLDAQVEHLKLEAAPYYRSGVLIAFPVTRLRAAVMEVVLDDGSPLPSGALGRVRGQAEEFPVALRGELYVSGLGTTDRIDLSWKGQRCTIEVSYPETTEPLPNLGKFLCKGVRP